MYFPRDDEDVLEADEGDEVWHDAHLGVHVEAESGEAEGHEDGAEDGEDCQMAKCDPFLS